MVMKFSFDNASGLESYLIEDLFTAKTWGQIKILKKEDFFWVNRIFECFLKIENIFQYQ
jgi:hypothetical protein